MSIGFHAQISEKKRKPFYPNLKMSMVVARCDDLSEVEGVITFPYKGWLREMRPERISFYIIREPEALEAVTRYKKGFIYNKQNDYVVMIHSVKILYLYGALHEGQYYKNVPGMYTDLTKNHNKAMTDLFEHHYIDRERLGCGCYKVRGDIDSPFIVTYKSNCERCNELGVTL